MRSFILKHKTHDAAVLQIHEKTGKVLKVQVLNAAYLPYLGQADESHLKFWWKMRGIPKSRSDLEEILKREHCDTSELFLMKNLGLSLTDTYWICPAEVSALSWDDVNLFDLREKNVRFRSGDMENLTGMVFTQNPNASLNASSVAYWNYMQNGWFLFKEDETRDGQQSINELFASEVHRRLDKADFTKYQRFFDRKQEKTGSVCRAFTSESLELVSAYEVANSTKKDNSSSEYEHFIHVCTMHGLPETYVRNFLDYQTMTDFLITNTDRHYNNFGLLRDADTMEIVSMAPIYDSGNSMFFRDPYKGTRAALLATKVSSIADTEEKMLRFVRSPHILDLSLIPTPNEVMDFYAERGIDEYKAGIIAQNYVLKRDMIRDLQAGKRLSVYMERQQDKNAGPRVHEKDMIDLDSLKLM